MNLSGTIHLNKTGITIICGLLLIVLLYSTSNRSENAKKENNLINLHQLLKVAIKAAEHGGKKVVETKDTMKVKSKGLTNEGLQDSVTTADFLSHCVMTGTLRYYFSELNIISEENHSCDKLDSIDDTLIKIDDFPEETVDVGDITVWIDPLDATQEYTEKSESLYKYITTMVCVALKGEPIIGVIHKPFNKITSWAWLGKGMSEDLKQKRKDVSHDENDIKIIVSRSHQGQIEKILKQKFKEKFEIIVAAGAGYKVLEVAYGNVNAYMHSTAIKKWDICAGNAIINAKGGQMTTKFNEKIDYSDTKNVKNDNGLIATIEKHEQFIGKL